ncbi:MAG: hypothetical protein KKG84_05660 [Candidatus Omnitrophica bacterium]|nr:hypothetical protein [Candidatus Omnitrophota bacterium]
MATQLAYADIVQLKNGRTITGRVVVQDEKVIEIDIGGGSVSLNMEEVDHVEEPGENVILAPVDNVETLSSSGSAAKTADVIDVIKEKWANYFGKDKEDIEKGRQHFLKATNFMKIGDADNAIIQFNKAISCGYKEGVTYSLLGVAYEAKGANSKARKYYRIALKELKKQLEYFEANNEKYMVNKTKMFIETAKNDLIRINAK